MAKNAPVVASVSTVQSQSYSGPLPQPRDFAEYNATLPGAADRILAMAERESEFRHADAKAARDETKRGQWMSLALAALAFMSAVACAALKQPTVGCIIAGTTLVAVVSAIMRIRAK